MKNSPSSEQYQSIILTASPLMIWFAAFNTQKLLVAQAVEIE